MNKKDGDVGHLEGYPREFYLVVNEILKDAEYMQYRLERLKNLIVEYAESLPGNPREQN